MVRAPGGMGLIVASGGMRVGALSRLRWGQAKIP